MTKKYVWCGAVFPHLPKDSRLAQGRLEHSGLKITALQFPEIGGNSPALKHATSQPTTEDAPIGQVLGILGRRGWLPGRKRMAQSTEALASPDCLSSMGRGTATRKVGVLMNMMVPNRPPALKTYGSNLNRSVTESHMLPRSSRKLRMSLHCTGGIAQVAPPRWHRLKPETRKPHCLFFSSPYQSGHPQVSEAWSAHSAAAAPDTASPGWSCIETNFPGDAGWASWAGQISSRPGASGLKSEASLHGGRRSAGGPMPLQVHQLLPAVESRTRYFLHEHRHYPAQMRSRAPTASGK